MTTLQTKHLLLIGVAVAGFIGTALGIPSPASANRKTLTNRTKPSIVLVHGAFADGSCWRYVIPILEKHGYNVIAVQNPLATFADDVAITRRVIDAQPGAVVVVGHSYGGAVITEATAGQTKVKALVYVAAFAPDAGENIGVLNERFKPSALGAALAPDSAGFLYIDRAKFRDVFCADVFGSEAMVMAATQKPIAGICFAAPVQNVGWKTIPSWYLVAQNDHAINPELERFMAKRIGARITEMRSSHVPFLSHPDAVAKLIEQAADATTND